MASVTARNALASPRVHTPGLNTVVCRMGNGSEGSLSTDTFQAVRIPNGATIIDGYIRAFFASGTVAMALNINVAGSQTALIASQSVATSATQTRFSSGSLPYKVSLSDDAIPQHAWVSAVFSALASCTNTWSLDVVIHYVPNSAASE